MICVLSVMATQARAADETVTVETLLWKVTHTRLAGRAASRWGAHGPVLQL